MAQVNIVSVSGGKDSAATLCVAEAQEVDNLFGAFADTGNEHQETYDYVDYLEQFMGIEIKRVKADFSFEIARRRTFIQEKWVSKGVSQSIVDRALEVLHPTGNPFLDLCLWKGRFPSSQARFCTKELKVKPIQQLYYPILENGDMILSWQGVRADESLARRFLPECNQVGEGLFNYRPILRWSVDDVFEAHRYRGIKINPLYLQGQSRVGCMPCVNCNKPELKEIAKRFPEEVERIAEWEKIVGQASKRQSSTFFTSEENRGHAIYDHVEWSKTTRGGKQYDLLGDLGESDSCSSAYGLCE